MSRYKGLVKQKCFLRWRLKVSADCIRRRCDAWQLVPRTRTGGRKRAVSQWWQRAWHCNGHRLSRSQTSCSTCSSGRCDEVDQVGWCVAVRTTMNNRTQLVLDALLNRKPVVISQQGGHPDSRVLKIVENLSAVGAQPRTPQGSSHRFSWPPSWWGGACCPSPRTPPQSIHSPLSIFGLALRSWPQWKFLGTPLSTTLAYTVTEIFFARRSSLGRWLQPV